MVWKRRFWFALLYFCEGAPIGLIWWAAPTLLRNRGVDLETLTAITSVSILPWTLKVFWSPLVDFLRNRLWSFPQWVALMQIGMALSLVPLFFFEWKDHPHLLVICFAIHGVFAATQDVSIDAWAIQETPEWDRARTAGLMEAGMLAGSWVFGGGTLFVSHWVDSKSMIFGMIFLLVSVALFSMTKRSFAPLASSASQGQGGIIWVLKRLQKVLFTRISWVGLFIAVTAGAVLKAFGVLFGPYLTDLGWSEVEVGSAFSLTTAATLLGSLAGGFLADKLGRVRVAQVTLVYLVMTSTVFFQMGSSSGGILLIGSAVFFGAGLFLSAFFGLLMTLSDSHMSATQFSFFMAGVNLCESWSGWAAGRWANSFGYDKAFLILSGISLLAIPVLGALKRWDRDQFDKSLNLNG